MPSRYFYFQMCWCAEFMLRQYISWSPHININWCNDEKPNQTMSSPRFCSAIQNYITRTSMTFWLIAPVQLDFSIDAEKVWNSHLPMAISILSWNDLSTITCPVRILMRLYQWLMRFMEVSNYRVFVALRPGGLMIIKSCVAENIDDKMDMMWCTLYFTCNFIRFIQKIRTKPTNIWVYRYLI